MATSAINEGIEFYTGENSYHGNCENNDLNADEFCQGAMMLPHDVNSPDPVVEELVHFRCDTDVAIANGLQGCQLIDDYDKCFGYILRDALDEEGNYEAYNGDISTRLQWIECVTDEPVDLTILE